MVLRRVPGPGRPAPVSAVEILPRGSYSSTARQRLSLAAVAHQPFIYWGSALIRKVQYSPAADQSGAARRSTSRKTDGPIHGRPGADGNFGVPGERGARDLSVVRLMLLVPWAAQAVPRHRDQPSGRRPGIPAAAGTARQYARRPARRSGERGRRPQGPNTSSAAKPGRGLQRLYTWVTRCRATRWSGAATRRCRRGT